MNIEKFTKSYKINPETNCFVWQLSTRSTGYGQVRYKGKRESAHRLSYKVFIGPIPEQHCVCHTCDNPLCVNPEHLFLGTAYDNAQDCKRKNRKSRIRTQSKLSPEQVLAIKRLLSKNKTVGIQSFIARWMGVTRACISAINKEVNWVSTKDNLSPTPS